jgi:hypothetical protein
LAVCAARRGRIGGSGEHHHDGLSGNKVRITLEMIVDVNRLAEVSSEMLRATVKRPVKTK